MRSHDNDSNDDNDVNIKSIDNSCSSRYYRHELIVYHLSHLRACQRDSNDEYGQCSNYFNRHIFANYTSHVNKCIINAHVNAPLFINYFNCNYIHKRRGRSEPRRSGNLNFCIPTKIGGLAFLGLLIFALWIWRRRQRQNKYISQIFDTPPAESPYYTAPRPRAPGTYRSPSSIMNQMMTAVYAAEDEVMAVYEHRGKPLGRLLHVSD
ncbi:hypothetical protein ONZ43_g2139 [Nemania bipapillata]|uniref:Uncharacterized protein n=1 Tax=Nemania bipapillata TaxID=110536 RepID=A0ACC2J1R8_9PEZI|nr:hypothetical protein ONZ43_g2139 [Nemania bipapillata]